MALGHLRCVYVDELLWDLSAPRSACEAYATTVCADLRLDWLACFIIQRRLKDAVDEEAKVRDMGHVGQAGSCWCPVALKGVGRRGG